MQAAPQDGDIGSTSEAYAVGHLGQVQVGSTMCRGFDEDFVTVNPYLGLLRISGAHHGSYITVGIAHAGCAPGCHLLSHDLIKRPIRTLLSAQIAMYEQFGVEGLITFQKTVEYCKQKGLVVIGDIKRGDTKQGPARPRWAPRSS